MVRIKRANGTWEDLDAAHPAPAPFQRSDGRVLTQDEIAAIARSNPTPQENNAVTAERTRMGVPAHIPRSSPRLKLTDEERRRRHLALLIRPPKPKPKPEPKPALTFEQLVERDEARVHRQREAKLRAAERKRRARAAAAPAEPKVIVRRGRTYPNAELIWQAVERLGTQIAAAKELGLSQGGVQSGLSRYMKAHGIEGPRPGLLPKRVAAWRRMAAAYAAVGGEPPDTSEPPSEIIPETIPLPEPPPGLAPIIVEEPSTDPNLEPLLRWLAQHGRGWTQQQHRRWTAAFLTTIALLYPPADA